jgi:hypothetical protein
MLTDSIQISAFMVTHRNYLSLIGSMVVREEDEESEDEEEEDKDTEAEES